ncbi:MAG: hypothetical protein JXR64_10195 [Spirochaetales bacterium]|nr:hypothetical protein [Spirochaetales bacterium]
MDFTFYSNREERLKSSSKETQRAYENRKKKSFLAKNPHLKILIIDLILVLLFGVIIVPFFMRITRDIRFDDYKVTSKAVQFEESILLSIKVIKVDKKIINRISNNNFIAEIAINKDNIEKKEVQLPIEIGDFKYITFKLDDNMKSKNIYVSIYSGNFKKDYNVLISR